jgi:hypothetical protein
MKTINVKSGLGKTSDGGYRVAFYERNEDHPDGEAFVADDLVHAVSPTADVMGAIHDGRLVDAGAGAKAGERVELPDAEDGVVLEVRPDDTAGDLEDRYNKAQLQALARARGVEVATSMTKAEIAEAILHAEPED